MNFLKEWKYSTLLAVSGGACALWWLVNRLPAKNNCNSNSNEDFIEHAGDFECIIRRRNECIPDLMNRLAEKHGDIFTITINTEQFIIVNSRNLIRLVGVAKHAKLFKDYFNTCSLLRKIDKNVKCNQDNHDPVSKFSIQFQDAIERYGNDYNFRMSLLSEVEKLLDVFRLYESSKASFDPCIYIYYATTNVLNSLLFGCRYTYKSKRMQCLVEVIDVNLSSKNIFCLNDKNEKCSSSQDDEETRACRNTNCQQNSIVVENLKQMLDLIGREIESHKKENGVVKYRDIIDIYLKFSANEKNTISRLNLNSTIIDFYTNGTQQMSSYLMWALYCMIEYPDVQNKCHDEIDENIGQIRPIVSKDLKNLPYINATLLEVSRRFTIIPLSQPLVLKEDLNLGPYCLAKNSVVVCNYHAVHMNECIWNEPLAFCPERFLNNLQTQNTCCQKLFNFGIEEKHCKCPVSDISFQTVFVFFANLLQKFDFEKCRQTGSLCRYKYNGVIQPLDLKFKVDSH